MDDPDFRFSGDGIEQAARVLSSQFANVVFYRTPFFGNSLPSEAIIGGYRRGFRRGVVSLSVPKEVSHALACRIGDSEFILPMRAPNLPDISKGLADACSGERPVLDAFREVGIYARKDFIKFLFVSPYGAYGKTLRVILPAQGVEDISYFLLRGGDNIDSIVYNIHLGSREGYRSLLSHTGFDVIGFSPVVIDNDVELMVDASRLSPRSLKIMGGVIVRHAPVEELLRAFPVDVVAYGPGESVCRDIADILSAGRGLSGLADVPNLAIYDSGRIIITPNRHASFKASLFRSDDIPLKERDVFHMSSYSDRRVEERMDTAHLKDHIGAKRFVVQYSDHCSGDCVFCNSPKNRIKPRDIEDIISEIRYNFVGGKEYDSIHFIDNTFSAHRDGLIAICERLVQEGLVDIPKACKLRADQASENVISALSRAGFKKIFFGIESFDAAVLDFMRKGTTPAENTAALELTLRYGMVPGMNLIIPSPSDSVESVLFTIGRAIDFVKRGAIINVTPRMYADYNTPLTMERPDLVAYRHFFIEGMRGIYRMPFAVKGDPRLESISRESQASVKALIETGSSEGSMKVSIHDYSLMYLSGICGQLGRLDLQSEIEAILGGGDDGRS